MSYGLSGSTYLTKLQGTVNLTGGFDAVADLAAGTYTGQLKLNQSSATFKLGGLLPASANVRFDAVGSSGGTVGNGALTYSGKVNVKLTRIKVFGLALFQGDDCQTVTPSAINLNSVGAFDPLTGGKIGGTYALSKMQGCGPLTSLISSYVESTGNTINLTLARK
jgi:hypothetical protein